MAERPSSDRPASGRPSSDRSRSDRPRDDRPGSGRPRRDDRPGSGRPSSDRSRSDRPRDDRPGSGRPSSDRPPRDDRPGSGRPTSDRSRSDRPRRDDRPGSGRPTSDRPSSDRPRRDDRPGSGRPTSDRPRRDDRPGSGRPSSDRPSSDRPRRDDRPGSGRPSSDRPSSDRPRRDDRPGSGRPSSERPRVDRPRDDRPRREEREGRGRSERSNSNGYPSRERSDEDSRESRGPWIPEEIQFEDLDKSVRFELQTLPESLQERVGRHLLAAEIAIGEDDMETALAHSRQAKKLAGRVAVVREANGTIEYLAGEYAAALNELRAVRRMTGSNDFVAMMADCERGLGRPEKAIEFLKSIPTKELAPETAIEALMVSAGARADMGQVDAALLMLNVGALTSLPAGDLRARMQESYSDLLDKAGRIEQAREWRSKALKSDINGITALTRAQESGITAHEIEDSD